MPSFSVRRFAPALLLSCLFLLAGPSRAEPVPLARTTTAPLAGAQRPFEPCQNRQTGLWGLCRADGSQAPPVVAQRYTFIGPGTELFPARLSAQDPMGYLDSEGAWRIAPRFDRAYAFSEGIGVVHQGGRSAGLDARGAEVIAWFDGLLYPPSQGLACFVPDGRIELGVLGRLRQRWLGDPGDDPYPAAWWRIEGQAGFLDTAGRVAIAPRFEPKINFLLSGCGFGSTGYAAMRQDGLEGVIDRSGRWVIAPEYDYLAMVFSGNRKVLAVIADRRLEAGWLLDRVERLDGFMDPDGALRWRETGPPREAPVAGGLARTALNQLLFPRWQQDLTNEDVSGRMLLAWVSSLLLALLAALLVLRRGRGAWRWLWAALAAAAALPLVFLAGLLSVYASGLMLMIGLWACLGRRVFRRSRLPAGAP